MKRLAAFCTLLLIVCTLAAQEPLPLDPLLGIATIPLWKEGAPGAQGTGPLDVPTLTLFRPAPGTENGTAVIIAPGGAYLFLASNLEGRQVADWFAARGVTAYLLRYRLGAKYPFPVPLLDAQRAIRMVRAAADRNRVDPQRIGMVGFSAGGHLTALAGTKFDAGNPRAEDPVDRVSSRPDFLVLGYPWINAMQPAYKGMITYCSVLPSTPPADCKRFDELYSPLRFVTEKTPPAFLYATTDDAVVPVMASMTMYAALREHGVPVEMHLFRQGAHGSGLGKGDATLGMWMTLLENWLRDQGWLSPGTLVANMQAAPLPLAGEQLSVASRTSVVLQNPKGRIILERFAGAEFFVTLKAKQLEDSVDKLAFVAPALFNDVTLAAIDQQLKQLR